VETLFIQARSKHSYDYVAFIWETTRYIPNFLRIARFLIEDIAKKPFGLFFRSQCTYINTGEDDDIAVCFVHSLQDERQRRQSAAGSMNESSFLSHMLDGLSVPSPVSH